jgi:AcrR family transcriptional regulator
VATQAERRGVAEEALLDAAARLFARKGVEATTLAEIGHEAGYSRGLANHHFGSRAALVERLAERTQRRFVARTTASLGGVEAIVEVVDRYIDGVGRAASEARAFIVMWGSSFPAEAPLRAVFVEDDSRFRRGVAALVHRGQASGAVRPDADPAAFGVVLIAMLRGVAAQFLVDPDAVDLTATRQAVRTLVDRYLTPEET